MSKPNHVKTTPRQATDDAYLAGLLDGEGTIQLKKEKQSNVKGRKGRPIKTNHGRTSYKLWVSIRLCTEQPLRSIHETYGGSLYCYKQKNPKWNDVWMWSVGNVAAEELLKIVFPYLRLKKRQAALAFKFREVIKQTLRTKDAHRLALRDALVEEMHQLNHRGKTVAAVETVRVTPNLGDDPVRASG